jgi:hypothetical protein
MSKDAWFFNIHKEIPFNRNDHPEYFSLGGNQTAFGKMMGRSFTVRSL